MPRWPNWLFLEMLSFTIMEKDFDNWNIQKKRAQAIKERPMFKEREVWWCTLGVNIGDEQDGKGIFIHSSCVCTEEI